MKNLKNFVSTILLAFILYPAFAKIQTPVFKWFSDGDTIYSPNFGPAVDKITGVTQYRFQLDTTPNFNSPLFNDTFHTNYYYITPKYPLGSTIYVRVKYYSATDSSDWNTPYHVWVSDKMKLAQPANGFSGSFKYLTWSNFDYPAYEIMIDTSPNFNSSMLYTNIYEGLTITRIKWDSFLFNTKYYWKVRALGTSDTTKWSEPWSFTFSVTPSITFPPVGSNYQIRSARTSLSWGDPGMCKIYYQLSKDPGFSTIDLKGTLEDNGTNHYGYVYFLDYETKYYARLKYVTKLDSTAWVTGGTLTTLDPRILDPYNGKTFSFYGDYVKWYGDYDDVDTFEIQIDTNMNFVNPFMDSFSTKLDLKFTPDKIERTYYVRVRALHYKDTSEWSDYRYFYSPKMGNGKLFYNPKDQAVDVPLNFQFQWLSNLYYMPYVQVFLDTTSNFNSSQLQVFEGDMISKTINTEYLRFGQTYYWKYRFGANGDTSIFSPVFSFTTWSGPLVYTYPPNGARNWLVHTYLDIKDPKIAGIEYYIYQLDTIPSFNSPVLQEGADSVLTTIETDGPYYLSQEYYWRVAAVNRNDTSDWGPIWNFQSQITYLNKPPNNSTNQETTVLLDWYGDTDLKGYLLQIDTSSNFNTKEITVTDVFNSQYEVKNLINNETYYWRVRSFHEFDTGAWSDVWNFTVKPLPALTKPTLSLPANNSKDIDYKKTIAFSWSSNGEVGTKYTLQISQKTSFSDLVYDNVELTNYVTISGWSKTTSYYWRVRYERPNGDIGPWSNIFKFTTNDDPLNGIEVSESEGLNIYPNPVYDKFTIKVNMQGEMRLTDSQGRLVMDKIIESGMNEIDMAGFSKGVYLIEIKTSEETILKKLVKL